MAVRGRGSQFARIIGKGYAHMRVLAFSFPNEFAQAACHFACMERRINYAIYDGTGSQLHIVIPPEEEGRLREIVDEYGGKDRLLAL